MTEWRSHADGFVHGDVGVFPYLFDSWEVWIYENGEWKALEGHPLYKEFSDAQAAALTIKGQLSNED
jgi:hypothetical protein